MRHRPIGEQLRAWRAARGLSQVALAERAGVGNVLVARLELGQTDPRLSTLRRLAEALKLTVGELVEETARPKKKERENGDQGIRRAKKEAGRKSALYVQGV